MGRVSAAAASADGVRPVVLFAMIPRERELFFRSGQERQAGLDAPALRWCEDLPVDGSWRDYLEEARPEVLVSCWSTPPLPRDWVAAPDCPLRCVCHVTGSVRDIVPRVFLERGGRVSNWGSFAARQVAEHALLLILAALRRLPDWRRVPWVEDGVMPAIQLQTRTLFDLRVGLHGFGAVAAAMLDLLRPFNVRVSAYSAGVPDAMMRARGVEPNRSLEELFAGSDVVIECEALTPDSAGSVNAKVLAGLPDGGIFVNVGRGPVVDEPALIREAKSGRIQVAVDVTADEPPEPGDPILAAGEILLSPHIAGPTCDRLVRCGELALANVRRFLRGEELESEVTLEIYDRST